ncbi:hypothetical protein CDAR_81211 [Caerostris darwini]|uniref:Uncharacterized protein n=1 Tax=Caerostris darwini TaxID=1538125 RepID=A0AAV4MJ79_9ARAC|nr:hypothetical protein CDAR_81211 [Caerostris darwini]
MSLNLRNCSDSGMKRSNSLPAVNSIFENKGVVKFFPGEIYQTANPTQVWNPLFSQLKEKLIQYLKRRTTMENSPLKFRRYICIQREDFRQNCQHHMSRNLKRLKNGFIVL